MNLDAARAAETLGLDVTRRHIFLCVKSTEQACCGGELAAKSWEHLKSRLKQLGLSEHGGIQRTKASKQSNRLGPIPFLGDLLGPRTNNNSRTDLIFFLRPTVLTNTAADNVDAFKRVDSLPQKDQIKKEIDPTYVAPKKTLIDKVLN